MLELSTRASNRLDNWALADTSLLSHCDGCANDIDRFGLASLQSQKYACLWYMSSFSDLELLQNCSEQPSVYVFVSKA